MKKIMMRCAWLVVMTLPSAIFAANTSVMTGGGASSVYHMFAQWGQAYHYNDGVKIKFRTLGSSAGMKALKAKKIAFAVTDVPLDQNVLRRNQWIQFPLAGSALVPIVNVSYVDANHMVLSGSLLARIYLGQIQYWDAPAITRLNPRLKLPHVKIILVRREHGSGATYVFTHYLSLTNSAWKKKVGYAQQVTWPVATKEAEGNAGVGVTVFRTQGAIGYVDHTYAMLYHLDVPKLRHQSGAIVAANATSFARPIAAARWRTAGYVRSDLLNGLITRGWPLVFVPYVVMPRHSKNNAELMRFFGWVLTDADKYTRSSDLVELPKRLISLVQQYWQRQ